MPPSSKFNRRSHSTPRRPKASCQLAAVSLMLASHPSLPLASKFAVLQSGRPRKLDRRRPRPRVEHGLGRLTLHESPPTTVPSANSLPVRRRDWYKHGSDPRDRGVAELRVSHARSASLLAPGRPTARCPRTRTLHTSLATPPASGSTRPASSPHSPSISRPTGISRANSTHRSCKLRAREHPHLPLSRDGRRAPACDTGGDAGCDRSRSRPYATRRGHR